MPGEGQAHAFHGVGDEAGGLVAGGVSGAEGFDEVVDVVAAEVGHEASEFVVAEGVDDGADAGFAAEVSEEGLAPGGAALEGDGGVEAVGAVVDPEAEGFAAVAGEGGLELAAVFDCDDVPAHVLEQAFDAAEQAVGDDAVEALAVVVDDPPDVADVVFPAFEEGFVDVALVQFGVAGDGDLAAGGECCGGAFAGGRGGGRSPA